MDIHTCFMLPIYARKGDKIFSGSRRRSIKITGLRKNMFGKRWPTRNI